jgi:hypothetical protein
MVQDGRSGYLNRSGRIVIKPRFNDAGHFSEGLAPIEINSKWGYINRRGKIVIAPQVDDADQFSEGLARIAIGEKFGYINRVQ